MLYKIAAELFKRGAIYILKHFFKKRKHNAQPENARIARRAVKLAKLAELYNVSMSENADRIIGITDRDLEALSGGVSPIVGCPANIIPMFAGYSQTCADCPYYLSSHNGNKQNGCVLKEEKYK